MRSPSPFQTFQVCGFTSVLPTGVRFQPLADDPLLTFADSAKQLGISKNTLTRLVRDKALKPAPGTKLIRLSQLKAYGK